MTPVSKQLALLREQHDDHMQVAYQLLIDGADVRDVNVMWGYGAGLMHAIRTIEDAMREH